MINSIVLSYRNLLNFSGRASRRQFWWFFLYWFIAGSLLLGLGIIVPPEFILIPRVVIVLWGAPTLVALVALILRRLHDTGRSGWIAFISCIPVVGGVWLLVLLAGESERVD
ncbi:MAG TPA: DUF805 domain-containing protein [Galbitalea sp.]|jgi:uncharacterized membrane protein YhaH (DUF805 family)|nr:DUF805 domain-containing protein [Galbitalea sp.]